MASRNDPRPEGCDDLSSHCSVRQDITLWWTAIQVWVCACMLVRTRLVYTVCVHVCVVVCVLS